MIAQVTRPGTGSLRTSCRRRWDGLVADDVVFYSPIGDTPQRGKGVTTMYLHAAAQTVPGDPVHGALDYTKQVLAGDVAMLELETTVGGK